MPTSTTDLVNVGKTHKIKNANLVCSVRTLNQINELYLSCDEVFHAVCLTATARYDWILPTHMAVIDWLIQHGARHEDEEI